MAKQVAAVLLLLTCGARVSVAAAEDGIVTEVTSDTITVQGELRAVKCRFCIELLTNSHDPRAMSPGAKINEVKVGDKVDIEVGGEERDLICTRISIMGPTKGQEIEKHK